MKTRSLSKFIRRVIPDSKNFIDHLGVFLIKRVFKLVKITNLFLNNQEHDISIKWLSTLINKV